MIVKKENIYRENVNNPLARDNDYVFVRVWVSE